MMLELKNSVESDLEAAIHTRKLAYTHYETVMQEINRLEATLRPVQAKLREAGRACTVADVTLHRVQRKSR